ARGAAVVTAGAAVTTTAQRRDRRHAVGEPAGRGDRAVRVLDQAARRAAEAVATTAAAAAARVAAVVDRGAVDAESVTRGRVGGMGVAAGARAGVVRLGARVEVAGDAPRGEPDQRERSRALHAERRAGVDRDRAGGARGDRGPAAGLRDRARAD